MAVVNPTDLTPPLEASGAAHRVSPTVALCAASQRVEKQNGRHSVVLLPGIVDVDYLTGVSHLHELLLPQPQGLASHLHNLRLISSDTLLVTRKKCLG